MRKTYYRDVIIAVLVLAVVLGLCRVTYGVVAILVALIGVVAAFLRRYGVVSMCYLFFPLLAVFNLEVIGTSPILPFASRFGGIVVTISLVVSGAALQRAYCEKLPIGWLFLYLLLVSFSSVGGWMPFISFAKIINFMLMLVGLIVVSRSIQFSSRGLYHLRVFMMAVAIIMIIGSFCSYFIPSIGYSMMVHSAARWGVDVTGTELIASGDRILFNGLTNHSQALSPVVVMLGAWVIGDMLLVERRISFLHMAVLFFVPILAYMSRSRVGFLVLVTLLFMVVFVIMPRIRVLAQTRVQLWMAIIAGILILLSGAIYFERKNDAISRWLRKTDNVQSDQRTFKEAFTDSRRDLVFENLNDFYRNPIFGMGFQVCPYFDYAYRAGLITWYSAPIEKGVTPLVILGEGGIVGAIAFLFFLMNFYKNSFKKRYFALIMSFTCFLVVNVAESNFFSPAGLGGILWAISCIGAFMTDVMAHRSGTVLA